MKFIHTHQSIIMSCACIFLLINEVLSFSSQGVNCSHLRRTNHQIGIQLRLNRVPFLSVNNFFARGGIPIQNSSTFTQKKRAHKKCPISWTKTIREKIMIEIIIQRKIIFFWWIYKRNSRKIKRLYLQYGYTIFR